MKYLSFIMILLLISCSNAPNIIYKIQCPNTIDYDKQSQNRLSNEIKQLPENSEIAKYLIGYEQERNMLKKCNKNIKGEK